MWHQLLSTEKQIGTVTVMSMNSGQDSEMAHDMKKPRVYAVGVRRDDVVVDLRPHGTDSHQSLTCIV